MAQAGTEYFVAVDGKSGTNGIIRINWRFGIPPKAQSLSQPGQLVRRGQPLSLGVTVTEANPPARFQWLRNGVPIAWATNMSLSLADVRRDEGGLYEVVVSNIMETLCLPVSYVEIEPVMVTMAESGFESDLENWQITDWNLVLDRRTSGGNPGGYLAVVGQSVAQPWYWRAPIKFLGDQSLMFRGYLVYELKHPVITTTNWQDPEVIITGGGLTLHYRSFTLPGTNWTTFNIPFKEFTGWERADGGPVMAEDLCQVLGQLTDLRIRGNYCPTAGEICLDNVALIAPSLNETPAMNLMPLTGQAVIFLEWPRDAVGFELLATDNLFQPTWTNLLPQLQIIVTNNLNHVLIPINSTQRFFLLRRP
jgi:hypothetical protein